MTASDLSITVAKGATPAPWWRRSCWLPLLIVLANFALLIAWPGFGRLVLQNVATPWTWGDALHHLFVGWCLSYLPLASLWLIFGRSRGWIRGPAVAGSVAVGTLLAFVGLWGGFDSVGYFWSYYLPKWPALLLLSAQLIAGIHLVLYPLRLLLGWRLDFACPSTIPQNQVRFQFSMRDLFRLTIATAVALAIIRGSYFSLARGRSDLLMVPMLLLLLWFGQILIPTLAGAWLIFAVKRQWIGGLVLGLSLACPLLILGTGWNVPLSMGARQLWSAHWMNLGAVACVAANLVSLRLFGLRLVIKARDYS